LKENRSTLEKICGVHSLHSRKGTEQGSGQLGESPFGGAMAEGTKKNQRKSTQKKGKQCGAIFGVGSMFMPPHKKGLNIGRGSVVGGKGGRVRTV